MGATTGRRRVVVVGPVQPFRGGIAQHTGFVARELDAICDLHTISFSRQYPQFLYPGQSDRDPQSADAELSRLEFSLDSVNPLSWRRTVRRIWEIGPDLVIIPNWTFVLAPCLGWIARGCRRAGIEVRIICHNVVDHEAGFWKRKLLHWARVPATAIVAQSRLDRDRLREYHPGVAVSAFPHPIHSGFPDAEPAPRRGALELLFFGLVRPYKGLDVLIEALPHLEGLDWRLSVVGEFWAGREETEQRITELGVAGRVEIIDRYVSDVEAASHFGRADMVVLPYRSATGSAVIPVAYRYGKPVIASRLEGLVDHVEDGKTGALVPAEDPVALADAIRRIAASSHDHAASIEQRKARMSWANLATHLVSPFDPEFAVGEAGHASAPHVLAEG